VKGVESGTWVDVLLVLAFVLMGGVFAATEIALVSLRPAQVDKLEHAGGRGHAVASLARDPNRFLSAVQIGVTVAGFFSAAFGASTLAPSFAPAFGGLGIPAPATVSLVVTTLVVSYLSLVLGELVPKRLALQRSVGVARLFAPPLGRFATVMTPVIWLLSISTDTLVRLLGGNPDAAGDQVDEEELRMMISGHEDIPEDERKIVDDVFEAGDRSLSEVMKPRGDVAFLSGDLTIAEAVEVISAQPYTRYQPLTRPAGQRPPDGCGLIHASHSPSGESANPSVRPAVSSEKPGVRTHDALPSIADTAKRASDCLSPKTPMLLVRLAIPTAATGPRTSSALDHVPGAFTAVGRCRSSSGTESSEPTSAVATAPMATEPSTNTATAIADTTAPRRLDLICTRASVPVRRRKAGQPPRSL
jgi:putative hemolysin